MKQEINIIEKEIPPDTLPIALDVSIAIPEITDEHPAELKITISNTSSEEILYSVKNEIDQVFGSRVSQEMSPGLVLVSQDDNVPVVKNASWKVSAVPEKMIAVSRRYLLKPGESVSEYFQLWQQPDNPTREFPTGTFHFEEEYTLTVDFRDTRRNEAFKWGFAIRI